MRTNRADYVSIGALERVLDRLHAEFYDVCDKRFISREDIYQLLRETAVPDLDQRLDMLLLGWDRGHCGTEGQEAATARRRCAQELRAARRSHER